ncbi:helix-turn-helix transcriptional regulator [Clostridioides difficile]|nr:helix-turn-helix transcriptional regulator [Clostridioides difficile]MCI9977731.1 helix-turn-helix transcriptional regulator [Clostridioides difficile]MDI7818416.1 helix-turn-helix transcriptional regulator [Clostridioides difficile]
MFSNRLRELRKQKGLTQMELAKLLNCSLSKIAMLETDKRDPVKEDLLRFSEIFDVSIDYLLGKDNLDLKLNKEMEQALHKLYSLDEENRKAIEKIIDNAYYKIINEEK